MSAQEPQTPRPATAKEPEPLQKAVTVIVAIIAATGAMTGFLNAQESGRASGATRAGLAAQSRASEQHITNGRILDADFDYISEAEILAFSATEYDAVGQTADAERARLLSRFLLTHTYASSNYYTDASIDEAVDQYAIVGFNAIWSGYGEFRDVLFAETAALQAAADEHLANASIAGRRAEGFLLSIALMAVAVSIGAVALVTKSPRWKLVDLAMVATFSSLALANVAFTISA